MARLAVLAVILLAVGCGRAEPRDTTNMTLSLSNGTELLNPSYDQVREALSTLNVARDGEGFAILGPSEMTYVQVSGDPQIGFDIEYQEGSVTEHYRAAREDYSLDETVDVLIAYRDGVIEWSEVGDFAKISW